MNILHIIPAFYPAIYWGGPIYSVYGLCNTLARIPGVTLRVLTTDSAGPNRCDSIEATDFPMRYPGGYEVYFCRRLWAASVSPGMIFRLWPMIRWADVVHLTAVYSPPTIPTLLICRLLGKPIVWSPRGALQRWEGATKPLIKRAWEWVCNALISWETCLLHVTSEQEATVSKTRFSNSDITLVSNGVDIPETLPNRSWLPDGNLRLLYLGRLHPIKGIENLLRAIQILANESIHLSICGNGDKAYTSELHDLVCNLGLERRVSFYGYVEDEEKREAFMQADVCVVPSFSENFGMVAAEALAHGVPVIASKGTPWAELEEHGCGMWVDNAPKSLAEAITTISGKELEKMGRKGREWAKKNLDWESVGVKMFNHYQDFFKQYGINGKL